MPFAYYRKPLNGEPWLDIDDARLELDYRWGCTLFTMAKRALRSEEEVAARLVHLQLDLSKPRTLRGKSRMVGN